jgi:hypothetical protein
MLPLPFLHFSADVRALFLILVASFVSKKENSTSE